MRKSVLLAFGVSLWLLWGLSGQAQEGDESRKLIDQAIKAHGGAAKLAAIKAIQMKAKGKAYSPMELTFTLDVSSQPPDKSKAVVEVTVMDMNFTIVNVVNGKKGWRSFMGKTEKLDDKEIEEHQQQAHIEKVTNLVSLKDKSYKLSPLGEAKVGEKDAVGVQVTKKGFRDVNLYFDKKTYMLLKAEYRTIEPIGKQEVQQEKLYVEYKEVAGGLKMPARMVLNNDGKKFMEIEVTEMTPMETPFEESVFAKPE
jgi:hypothetical protein